jgi:hypothetical protein
MNGGQRGNLGGLRGRRQLVRGNAYRVGLGQGRRRMYNNDDVYAQTQGNGQRQQ